jgi:hypothetical protein
MKRGHVRGLHERPDGRGNRNRALRSDRCSLRSRHLHRPEGHDVDLTLQCRHMSGNGLRYQLGARIVTDLGSGLIGTSRVDMDN